MPVGVSATGIFNYPPILRVKAGNYPPNLRVIFTGVSSVKTERKVTHVMFSADTWEKTGELYEGDRVLRKQSEDYLKNTIEILKDEPYTKTYHRVMFAVANCLTGAEMQLAYILLQFLSYESGMLKHQNGQPVTRQYIAQYTGLSLKTVDKLLQKLKEKQVIGRNVVGREVQYFMNPWLFMRGQRINKTLYDMFKNSRWAKIYEIKRGAPDGTK